ncbi:MAG: hypothetical protein ABIO70_10655 [Pseudomonadota bacterium]
MFHYPLPLPADTVYTRLGVTPEVDPAALARALNAFRAAREREQLTLRAKQEAKGSFSPEEQRRLDELAEELRELNGLALDSEVGRATYDGEHPPLALLKLVEGSVPLYDDWGATLAMLRKELTEWIEAKGEPVAHPTDLSRRDFSGDFTHLDLLDGGGP